MPSFRLILCDELEGRWNMALDEAMMTLAEPDVITVRLYGWASPCISIGHFQTIPRAVDLDSCRQMQLPIVRRPTGGRAVLHEQQIAYALVCSTSNPLAEGKTIDAYRRISQILVRGLELLGKRPALAPRTPGAPRTVTATLQACLQMHAQHELLLDGKKLSGSAQLRRDGALLQHGFLMLEFNPQRTARALRGKDSASLARQLESHATSLRAALGRTSTFVEVRHALADAFQEALGPATGGASLSEAETTLATWLLNERYPTLGAEG
ncbi:MAG: lipoate--protein ligase family protein [Chloroflexota bacterium]|nr:MAG: lipoate--protein ligase family protein [Chloroflexota bacterium]